MHFSLHSPLDMDAEEELKLCSLYGSQSRSLHFTNRTGRKLKLGIQELWYFILFWLGGFNHGWGVQKENLGSIISSYYHALGAVHI